jgi:hypothetical protein
MDRQGLGMPQRAAFQASFSAGGAKLSAQDAELLHGRDGSMPRLVAGPGSACLPIVGSRCLGFFNLFKKSIGDSIQNREGSGAL